MPSQRSLGGWVVVLALVLAGCSGGADTAGDATAGTTTIATDSTSTSATDRPSASDAIAVVLAPDRLVVGGNALVYGAAESQVRAYLDRALGAPLATEEQDCGPGRLTSIRWDGITAYVDAGGFVGWTVEDDTFATAQGIRRGSPRTEVEAAFPQATVTESTLGTEFFAPGPEPDTGLSGIYEANEVAALWSGATCIAR